jgi:hypothetical protein
MCVIETKSYEYGEPLDDGITKCRDVLADGLNPFYCTKRDEKEVIYPLLHQSRPATRSMPTMVMREMKMMRTMMRRRKMEIRNDEEDVPEAANQVGTGLP